MTVQVIWWPLLPVLVPAVGAVLMLLVDALLPRIGRWHWLATAILSFAGAALSFPGVLPGTHGTRTSLCMPAGCLYKVDHVGTGLQILALAAAGVVALLAFPIPTPRMRVPVQAALVLATASGTAGVIAARDIASWLVMLELATVPTVALVALRARKDALDGAFHLLTAALLSFAILVMGAALWFAASGSELFDADAVLRAAADPDQRRLLLLAGAFFVAGLGFKLAAVPFHSWMPEALEGASMPVGAYLSVVSKMAALGALLVVMRGVTLLGTPVLVAFGVLAAVTMTVGNLVALRQTRTLRFLAWSAIAQSGWFLIPLATNAASSVRAAAGYLVVYAAATLLAFAVVTAIAHAEGRAEATELTSYAGLLRRRPLLGSALGMALLVLAGLPPGVVGLVAKVLALRSVASDQTWWLAVIAALNVMLGVAVYLKWLRILLHANIDADSDASETIDEDITPERAHPVHYLVVGLGLVGLIVTSAWPSLLLRFVSS